MATLLTTAALGVRSPSPVSPLFNSSSNPSANPSPPHSPGRNVSPLTPGMPSKPWANASVPSPVTPAPLTPPTYSLGWDGESPMGTPVPFVIPPRVDSYKSSSGSGGDSHVQRTASSYIARPLPKPPGSGLIPIDVSSVVKPWVNQSEHNSPATSQRSMNSSPKYSLFPKVSSASPRGTTRFPSTPLKTQRFDSLPEKSSVSVPLQKAGSSTTAKHKDADRETRPPMREWRSNTEPSIQPFDDASQWQPRSSSLNRTQTDPVSSPDVYSPSVSFTPIQRRPSAIEVIAAKEIGRRTKLKAGPRHDFQVAVMHAPEIESQKAVKWVKKSEKMQQQHRPKIERKPAPQQLRERAASAAGISDEQLPPSFHRRKSSSCLPPVAPIELPMEVTPKPHLTALFTNSEGPITVADSPTLSTDVGDVDSPTIGRPHPLRQLERSPVDTSPTTEAPSSSTRGRTLQRTQVPTPLALGEPAVAPSASAAIPVAAPAAQKWHLPPARGPLQIRASTFKPFSHQLDADAIAAFSMLQPRATSAEPPQTSTRSKVDAAPISGLDVAQTAFPQRGSSLDREQSAANATKTIAATTAAAKQQSRRKKSISTPPGAAPFLQVRPLPPSPPLSMGLAVREEPAAQPSPARMPGPLAKLAALVK